MSRDLLPFEGEFAPQTVQDQIDDSAGYTITFTVAGDVEEKWYEPMWVAPRACIVVGVTATLGLHRAATHPDEDGAAAGVVGIAGYRWARVSGNYQEMGYEGDWFEFWIPTGEHFAVWDPNLNTSNTQPFSLNQHDALSIRVYKPYGGPSFNMGSNLVVHVALVNE